MGRDGNGDEGISGGGSRDMVETGESWSSVSSFSSLSTSHRHFVALLVRLARGMVQVDSEAVADSGLGGAEANLRGAVLKRAGAALAGLGLQWQVCIGQELVGGHAWAHVAAIEASVVVAAKMR
jgi:hypothetical protein